MPDGEAQLAYRLLIERINNEDRISAERLSIFLLGNTFLLLGFVEIMSGAGPRNPEPLAVAIAAVGIGYSLFAMRLLLFAMRVLGHMKRQLRELHDEAFPHLAVDAFDPLPGIGNDWRVVRWVHVRFAYVVGLPGLMIFLWVTSVLWIWLA